MTKREELITINGVEKVCVRNDYRTELNHILFEKYGVREYGQNTLNHLDGYVNDNGGEITLIIHNYGVITSIPYEVLESMTEIKYHAMVENMLSSFDVTCSKIKEHLSAFTM